MVEFKGILVDDKFRPKFNKWTEMVAQVTSRAEGKEGLTRLGVVIVIAHRDPATGKVKIFLEEYKELEKRGVKAGDLGLPSESVRIKEIKKYDGAQEYINAAMIRCFRSELGVELGKYNLGRDPSRSYIDFLFDDVRPRVIISENEYKAGGRIGIFWIDEPDKLVLDCNQTKEVRRGLFMDLDTILNTDAQISFRKIPSTIDIIRGLSDFGYLNPQKKLIQVRQFKSNQL